MCLKLGSVWQRRFRFAVAEDEKKIGLRFFAVAAGNEESYSFFFFPTVCVSYITNRIIGNSRITIFLLYILLTYIDIYQDIAEVYV